MNFISFNIVSNYNIIAMERWVWIILMSASVILTSGNLGISVLKITRSDFIISASAGEGANWGVDLEGQMESWGEKGCSRTVHSLWVHFRMAWGELLQILGGRTKAQVTSDLSRWPQGTARHENRCTGGRWLGQAGTDMFRKGSLNRMRK